MAMKHELNFWVVGGDMRQCKLAQLLAEDGHRVHTYGMEEGVTPVSGLTMEKSLEGITLADCVVLPLPISDGDGELNAPLTQQKLMIADVLGVLAPKQVVCGGRVDAETAALAAERGHTILDYYAREELIVANAVPTAEAVLQVALREMPITLHNARVLVLGFGRVGFMIAHQMAALGAKVSVAARRYDALAWAKAMGYGAEKIGELVGWMCGYDLVVNTVPSMVLREAELADMKPDALIIDMASKPGGVDTQAAARLNRKVVRALALPGKTAPVTAGGIIKDTIYNMLQELDA